MDVIFSSYTGQVVPISIHMWWPYNQDPWYLFDRDDAVARFYYYNMGYVPTFRYNGEYIFDPSDFVTDAEWYAWFRNTMDSLLAVPSPIRINLEQYPSQDWDSVYVSFDIVAVDSIASVDPRVFLAVTEDYHRYPYPVGKWRYALREFVPDSCGYAVTLQKGDSLHFDWTYLVDSVYNLDAITTNIFVQGYDNGTIFQAASARVTDVASVTPGDTPARIWLGQNAPNPFTTGTRIAYRLGASGAVRLSVYTPTGRLVANLVDTYLEPGSYAATWDGRDAAGRAVGSGMYYYRLDAGAISRSGRMVLLK
jgi:hypothetical protein